MKMARRPGAKPTLRMDLQSPSPPNHERGLDAIERVVGEQTQTEARAGRGDLVLHGVGRVCDDLAHEPCLKGDTMRSSRSSTMMMDVFSSSSSSSAIEEIRQPNLIWVVSRMNWLAGSEHVSAHLHYTTISTSRTATLGCLAPATSRSLRPVPLLTEV